VLLAPEVWRSTTYAYIEILSPCIVIIALAALSKYQWLHHNSFLTAITNTVFCCEMKSNSTSVSHHARHSSK